MLSRNRYTYGITTVPVKPQHSDAETTTTVMTSDNVTRMNPANPALKNELGQKH
jgi:hypothetical protein